jgi:hypothetical protein
MAAPACAARAWYAPRCNALQRHRLELHPKYLYIYVYLHTVWLGPPLLTSASGPDCGSATSAPGLTGLAAAHICAGTRARPCHICTGTDWAMGHGHKHRCAARHCCMQHGARCPSLEIASFLPPSATLQGCFASRYVASRAHIYVCSNRGRALHQLPTLMRSLPPAVPMTHAHALCAHTHAHPHTRTDTLTRTHTHAYKHAR